jgi:hypothetical protein
LPAGPLAIGLLLAPDFFLDLGEVVVGVAQGVMDLGKRETRVDSLNGLHGVSRTGAEIDESNRDACASNDGIAPTDGWVFLDMRMLGLKGFGHGLKLT